MPPCRFTVHPIASVVFLVAAADALAQTPPGDPAAVTRLDTVTVSASADASAGGLPPVYPGGQVARGSRAGILGNLDTMDSPFNATAYTNDLIQNQQAKSVGDVLLNDPSVRVARGFGNFQESYFIRGFILNSDDVAYNGLYSLLPRQYIAAELFERVEVLRGASAFLNGAAPGGDGIGGSINLLPKRAPNQPLTEVTLGGASGGQGYGAVDVARRFGPDQSFGLRVNAAKREGGTGVENEHLDLDVVSLGADWRSATARVSADVGFQDNRLKQTRTNVSLDGSLTAVPTPPSSDRNWAQPWSYSNERDTFGTVRAEYDLAPSVTAWIAAGLRRSREANSLANITVTSATTGAASTYRFDNTREDHVDTGEVGLRGKLGTGPVDHALVVSASYFKLDKRNAYGFSNFFGPTLLQTNLYNPVASPQPALAFFGNRLDAPATTGVTKLTSIAVADTVSGFDDRVHVTGGARAQKIDIRDFAYTTGTENPRYAQSRTSPVGGIVLRVAKEVSLYANYIESLSQGETAPSTAVNIGAQLPPYVSRQKEIGVKLDSGLVGGSVALFSTSRPRAFVDASNVFATAGLDRHRGVELSAYGIVAKGLRILGGVTLLDAQQLATGSAPTDGKQVIGIPRRQGTLGVEWDIPGVDGLSLDARAEANGRVYTDAANTLALAGWTRFDLGARYGFDALGRPVTLRARVDNLANRNYWASAGGYPGAGYLVLGGPRTITVSAAVDF